MQRINIPEGMMKAATEATSNISRTVLCPPAMGSKPRYNG
jgi:hypothetical protein